MNDVRNSVTCKRCREDFGFNAVRMLPEGGVACLPCLGVAEKEARQERERNERIWDYQCIDCRFRFRRNTGNVPRVCPECGGVQLVKFDSAQITSSKILEIADDPRLEALDRVKPGEFR